MLARKETKQPVTHVQQSQSNLSYFTLYADGIGFNDYSIRLSNFSLNNIPRNLALITSFAMNIGVSAKNICRETKYFTVINQLNGMNHFFHYSVEIPNDKGTYSFNVPVDLKPFIDAISNNTCHAVFNPERQNEYNDMNFKTIYSLPQNRNFICPDIFLNRDTSQPNPLFGTTEDCLKKLIDNTYKIAVNASEIASEVAWQHREKILGEVINELKVATPYLLTVGLFSAGYYAYKKYKNNAINQNNFSNRLAKIKYKKFIPQEFICPISLSIMNDPVKTNDGITYDRPSIENWIAKNTYSPSNPSIKIQKNTIVSDLICKNRIEKFVHSAEHPEAKQVTHHQRRKNR